MSNKVKSIFKSYARGVLVAVTPLILINETDAKAYIVAIVAGVISPALRALDKKDPAFGLIADVVDVELDKLAKKDSKKKKKA